MRNLLFFLIFNLLIAVNSFAGGKVNKFTLSNGLEVLHKKITNNPLVTVQLFFNSGSINEKESQAGLAHFTQVIMMKSTKNRSNKELSIEIEQIGAHLSSDVSHDFCSLGVSLVDKYTEKGIELLADVVLNPAFEETEIEKERTNILAGLKSRHDRIFNLAIDNFHTNFYGNHPYSWPDSGKAETVSKFTKSDMINWHKNLYTVEHAFMLVTGNIDVEEVKKSLEKYFSKLPKATKKSNFAIPEVKIPALTKKIIETEKFQQAYLIIGYPAPSIGKDDYITLKIINSILGSRMSARLFTELREKLSLAYEVNSYYSSRKAQSGFVFYMGLSKENLDIAKSKIFEIIKDLKTNPISEQELSDSKNYITGGYMMDHQTIGRQAWYLGWWEIMGMGHEYDNKYPENLSKVTKEDVLTVAKKYFSQDYVQIEVVPSK